MTTATGRDTTGLLRMAVPLPPQRLAVASEAASITELMRAAVLQEFLALPSRSDLRSGSWYDATKYAYASRM